MAVKSRVVRVRNARVVGADGRIDTTLLGAMVSEGVQRLAGLKSADDAWRTYFRPADRIGIKVNCLGGAKMCTHPVLSAAACDGLEAAGFPAKKIIVWDRYDRELKSCGFPLNYSKSGVRCFGTDAAGAGYEEDLTVSGEVASRLSRVLTRMIDARLNMPVLKDHGISGITCALKNVFGSVHNPNKFHGNRCDPYIPDANRIPAVKDKTRLIVCDALVVQYNGGPGYKAWWAAPYGGLLFATDPVALDAVGYRIIDELRRTKDMPRLADAGRPPTHLETAARQGLGRVEKGDIELVDVEV